jgi:hypothetical protein
LLEAPKTRLLVISRPTEPSGAKGTKRNKKNASFYAGNGYDFPSKMVFCLDFLL